MCIRSSFISAYLYLVGLLPLLWLTACDSAGLSGPADQQGIILSFEQAINRDQTSTGTFSASGAVVDKGTFEGWIARGESSFYGENCLEGSKGTVVIRYRGTVTEAGNLAEGTFSISDGRGNYQYLPEKVPSR